MKRKKIKKQILLLVVAIIITCFPTRSNVASTTPEQQFRQLYFNLLKNSDNSTQDISHWDLPYMTCYYIMEDVKQNEGFLSYHCYQNYNLLTIDKMETKENTPYLYQFHLSQNDPQFQQRYDKVKQIITTLQSQLDDKMTDLDKLLYFHEYVVAQIFYKDAGTSGEHLGGTTLAQGYGVCEGYANALMLFLKEEQIPCEILSGGAHAWLAVKIDGHWYHVDPTWDDTVSSRYGTHYFLLRNDEEFINTMDKKHAQWIVDGTFLGTKPDISCTATDYTSWYVHDVRNRMYYYDGYWYYILHNTVRKNNISGTNESIIYEGQSPNITGIEDGILTIINGNNIEKVDLKNNTTAIPSPSATPAETIIPSATKETIATATPSYTENIVITPPPSQPENTVTTSIPSQTENAVTTSTPSQTENAVTTLTPCPTQTTDITLKPVETNLSMENSLKKPVIKTLTNKKGHKIKLKLKKKIAGAKGYKVVYSTNKTFKKKVKTVTFKGTRKTKIIEHLQKNKIYYVKVASYKKDLNNRIIYSSYSRVKKIKIQK